MAACCPFLHSVHNMACRRGGGGTKVSKRHGLCSFEVGNGCAISCNSSTEPVPVAQVFNCIHPVCSPVFHSRAQAHWWQLAWSYTPTSLLSNPPTTSVVFLLSVYMPSPHIRVEWRPHIACSSNQVCQQENQLSFLITYSIGIARLVFKSTEMMIVVSGMCNVWSKWKTGFWGPVTTTKGHLRLREVVWL